MRFLTKCLVIAVILFAGLSTETIAQNIISSFDNYTLRHEKPDTYGPETCNGCRQVNWNTSAYEEWVFWERDDRYTVNRTWYVKRKMNFRLIKPNNYDPNKPGGYPVIVHLSGCGETGRYTCGGNQVETERWDNNVTQLGWNTSWMGKNHELAVTSGEFEGFVLVPQADFPGWENGLSNPNASPTMELLYFMVEEFVKEFPVDGTKLYIHGFSNGGKGVWDAVNRRPDLWAATLPMSATGSNSMFDELGHMPIWHFQGETDGNPPAQSSRNLRNHFESNGGNYRYTEYAGVGHGVWPPAYDEPDFFTWMLDQTQKNIHAFFGETDINAAGGSVKLGIAPGHLEYEWYRDGSLLGGEDGNQLIATLGGDYSVRWKRFDGSWVDSKILTITGPANNNIAPTADAGSDQTIDLPTNSANLSGSGSDSDGTIVSYQWSQQSGPSTATISNANSSNTSISGLSQGTYDFRLLVTDNQGGTGSDNVIVTVQIDPAGVGDVLYRVNVGGSNVGNSQGDWLVDTKNNAVEYAEGTAPSTSWNGCGLFSGSNSTSAPNEIFCPYKYEPSWANMDYEFPVSNGLVTVRLYFAERVLNSAGQRVFDVNLEGNTEFDDLDIYSEVGKNVTLMKEVTLNITDGSVSLAFGRVTGDPVLNGIEILGSDGGGNNQAPVAVAGTNQTITLPANSVTLDGSASTDSDGNIASYNWTLISGPNTPNFSGPNSVQTTVSGLIAGNYNVRLTVTDNAGATAGDDILITVNASGGNVPPTANAGSDISIEFPTQTTTFNGTANDTDGTISSFAWAQLSGPVTAIIASPNSATTTIFSLSVMGSYVFRLTATDNEGSTGVSDISVFVINGGTAGDPIYRVNAGGGLISDAPLDWSIDTQGSKSSYLSSSSSNNTTGWNYNNPNNPTGAPGQIFGTHRYDAPWGGAMQYAFPVSNGTYDVKLYFAEKPFSSTAVGARVFSVEIENNNVLSNYDIVSSVGNGGDQKNFQVVVSDGEINIDFVRQIGNPIVSGIEIVPINAPPPVFEKKAAVVANLYLYPNPAIDKINVSFMTHEDDSEVEVLIYDNSMRLVSAVSRVLSKGQYQVDLDISKNITPGIYMMVVNTPHFRNQVSRFIKE